MNRSLDFLIGAGVSLAVHLALIFGAVALLPAILTPARPLFSEGESSLALTFFEPAAAAPAAAPEIKPTAPPPPPAPPPAPVYTESKPEEPVALVAPVKPAAPPPALPAEPEEEEAEKMPVPAALPAAAQTLPGAGQTPAGPGMPAGGPAAASGGSSSGSGLNSGDALSKGVAGGIQMGSGIHPVYPLGSRLRGEEGVVRLQVTVSPAGKARTIAVLQSSGYPALDEAAQAAVRRARFIPARQNGKPVESELPLNFRFRLTD